MNYIDPEREQFGAFRAIEREGKIHMLNLVKLKKTATYEDGTMVTGAEAYAAYSRETAPILQRVGGRIAWSGAFELTLIGPSDETWDLCFIAEYPNGDAFVSMVKDPEYQKAVKHRQAGVETSRLIRMNPKDVGGGFG